MKKQTTFKDEKKETIYSKEQIEFDEDELDKLKMSNLVLYSKYKKEFDLMKKDLEKK